VKVPARMTFVGIDSDGVVRLLMQDPETYDPLLVPRSPRPKSYDSYDRLDEIEWLEEKLEEYMGLVDDLRYYARVGQVKLVSDDELKPYVASMSTATPVVKL
jgi:hypothetical protein